MTLPNGELYNRLVSKFIGQGLYPYDDQIWHRYYFGTFVEPLARVPAFLGFECVARAGRLTQLRARESNIPLL